MNHKIIHVFDIILTPYYFYAVKLLKGVAPQL